MNMNNGQARPDVLKAFAQIGNAEKSSNEKIKDLVSYFFKRAGSTEGPLNPRETGHLLIAIENHAAAALMAKQEADNAFEMFWAKEMGDKFSSISSVAKMAGEMAWNERSRRE